MADRTRRTSTLPTPKLRSVAGSTLSSPSSRRRGDGGASSDEDLAKQNTDLRQRLHDEAAVYRKRLDTYRLAQQNQATLVSRLQAKVLQYKQRCADLETQIDAEHADASRQHQAAAGSALEQAQQHLRDARQERITDLEAALGALEAERRTSRQLRRQLEDSQLSNEELADDLQKLTEQFDELREEMALKEEEWRDEERAFNDYYSTEHGRLLGLWRDVVSIKRLFADVQSATQRDLGRLRSELEASGEDVAVECGKLERGLRSESLLSLQEPAKFSLESAELRSQLDSMRAQFESQRADLRNKEDKIQQLHNEIQILEDRCADAERSVSQVLRLQDDVEQLQSSLRDIAHALIQDAEGHDEAQALSAAHVHLSTPIPLPKSPKRVARALSSSGGAALAQSTVSAVQAALHQHRSVIHELQVKLHTNKEQCHLARRNLEQADVQVVDLERQLRETVAQLDACKSQCAHACEERNALQKQLEWSKGEKSASDRQRGDALAQLESARRDVERAQKANAKLQKDLEMWLDEKAYLQNEVDRLQQDGALREMNLRAEEDRSSRIREELLAARERLDKLCLSNELLTQQKLEGDASAQQLEQARADLELQVERVGLERDALCVELAGKEKRAAALDADKRRLLEAIGRHEQEKAQLQAQLGEHASDAQSLRKELLQAEQARLDLESDKVSLQEKLQLLEMEKSKVEMEVGHVARDRADLSQQLGALARKTDVVGEELARTKQKFEQQAETNTRINRHLEELVREAEAKQCALDALEKELRRCQEGVTAARAEKEALEAVLFDSQTNLEACEAKRSELENEVQALRVHEEASKGEVCRLQKDLERAEKRVLEVKQHLTTLAASQEGEFQQVVGGLRTQHEAVVKQLGEERESLRTSAEKRLQQLMAEKDAEIGQLTERLENLQAHVEIMMQQHEELMLRAENDKQQALLLAHHDQRELQERLEQCKRALREEKDGLERLKRDGSAALEQHRCASNQAKEECNRLRAKLEETRVEREADVQRLHAQLDELQREKEAATTNVRNLTVQVHVYEDKLESLTAQAHDTVRRLKECESVADGLRKDLTDVRRQLGDCSLERETYHASNKELRELVKRIEGEKREQSRQLEEVHQRLSVAEEVKRTAESDRCRLQSVVQEAEKAQTQLECRVQSLVEEVQRQEARESRAGAEEKVLQARLLNEAEEREGVQKEAHAARKQCGELERSLEQTRKELVVLRGQQQQLEGQWHAREEELLAHLEDCRGREKRLEDEKHNLEVCLADASQQLHEARMKLAAGESRLKALEGSMGETEERKRDAEAKLTSVVATLRRIAGIQLDGSIAPPQNRRLTSPSRRWSPTRHKDAPEIVDPEAVRTGVRNLMAQVAHVERERDDLQAQIVAVRKQLQDAAFAGDAKLAKALSNLRALQEEKGAMEAKFGQKVVACNAQTEALTRKSEEVQSLREKIGHFEVVLAAKQQLEEKCDKLKLALHKGDAEKRTLQEDVARAESRMAKMELQLMSAEGDLHRLQMMLQERDGMVQTLNENGEVQARSVAGLEERCASLKSTIDQLHRSLEMAANGESELKIELHSLQRRLAEGATQSHADQERLKHLQQALASAENDKTIVAERFEAGQRDLGDLRRNNQALQDQQNRLHNELANCEVQKSGLESQLRMSRWPGDAAVGGHREDELVRQLQGVQRERNDLRAKVEALNSKVRQIESENRQEKHQLDAYAEKDENRELRSKIAKLERALSENEAELSRLRLQTCSEMKYVAGGDAERYRAAQLQAERLLEARELSHRQQVQRLEHQVAALREQLDREIKRRQQYVTRSSRAGREMQQLRQALGDSLRTVSQDPCVDALLLEQEARKLDHTASGTASLPPY